MQCRNRLFKAVMATLPDQKVDPKSPFENIIADILEEIIDKIELENKGLSK